MVLSICTSVNCVHNNSKDAFLKYFIFGHNLYRDISSDAVVNLYCSLLDVCIMTQYFIGGQPVFVADSDCTEMEMSSFWWNFHHWLHWKLSKWQLPVQPVIKISSKWRHFRFSDWQCQKTPLLSSKCKNGCLTSFWKWITPGPRFNIKMSSYQYRKSYCGDKTVVRSSYLHNEISYPGKMTSLYWIRPLDLNCMISLVRINLLDWE